MITEHSNNTNPNELIINNNALIILTGGRIVFTTFTEIPRKRKCMQYTTRELRPKYSNNEHLFICLDKNSASFFYKIYYTRGSFVNRQILT